MFKLGCIIPNFSNTCLHSFTCADFYAFKGIFQASDEGLLPNDIEIWLKDHQ